MDGRSWWWCLVNMDLLALDFLAEMTLSLEKVLVEVSSLVTALGYSSESVPKVVGQQRNVC